MSVCGGGGSIVGGYSVSGKSGWVGLGLSLGWGEVEEKWRVKEKGKKIQ